MTTTKQIATNASATSTTSQKPASFLKLLLVNLFTRAPHYAGINYGVDEQAGYFSTNTQGAAA